MILDIGDSGHYLPQQGTGGAGAEQELRSMTIMPVGSCTVAALCDQRCGVAVLQRLVT